MSSIEELQKRVVEAESRFGLINERRTKYSERLVGLIDAVEARLREQTAAVQSQAEELASQIEISRHATEENQAMRGMLHSLLRAIEAGSRDVLTDAMQAMDAKVSTLIAETETGGPVLSPPRQKVLPKPIAEVPPLDPVVEAEATPDVASEETPGATPEAAPEAISEAVPEADTDATRAVDAQGVDDTDSNASEEPAAASLDSDPAVSDTAPIDALADSPFAETDESADALDTTEPDTTEPDAQESGARESGELSAAQVAELLGSAAETAAPEEFQEPEAYQSFPVEDDDLMADLAAAPSLDDLGDMEPPQTDAEPDRGEPMALADEPGEEVAAENDFAEPEPLDAARGLEAEAAFEDPELDAAVQDAEPEPAPVILEESAPEPDPLQDDTAEPDSSAMDTPDEDGAEAASLEDIMRRVSKLVEDEGALGPLGTGSVRIGAGADDAAAAERDDKSRAPATAKKAVSF